MEKIAKKISSSAATLAVPWIFVKGVLNKSWRGSLGERCGLGAWSEDVWHEREVVWFHGASVGEIGGLRPLLMEIRKCYPELHLLVTTTSLTGRREVEKQRLGDSAILFPLDHPTYVKRAFERVRPKLIVVSETELWPNFLFLAKERGIPVVLLNGRISDYSYPRYLKFKAIFGPVLRSIQRILVQTERDKERFLSIGAQAEQVLVAGNTKYAQQMPGFDNAVRQEAASDYGIDLDRPCLVAGSVRATEDEMLIRAFAEVRKEVPSLQLIIAPRHPERFEKVARLLGSYKLSFARRSLSETAAAGGVLLLDTIGELNRAYSLASFAFVGGSLVDIGGHNPFEPAAYKTPVIFGPYARNVEEAVGELSQSGGLIQLKDESELKTVISRLAQSPDECLLRGARAYETWKANSQALETVLPVMLPYLEN